VYVRDREDMMKRHFVIKCLSKDICINLLNKINEEISVRWLKTQVKDTSLIIEVVGMPYELRELKYEILSIKNSLEFYLKKHKEFKVEELVSKARVTVPLDALIEVLKLLGYNAERSEDGIRTDAPSEKIIETMIKMHEVYESDVVRFRLPHSAKKVIMVVHALYNIPPEEIIEIMKNLNLIEEGEFKYEIKEEWRKVVTKLVNSLNRLQEGAQEP